MGELDTRKIRSYFPSGKRCATGFRTLLHSFGEKFDRKRLPGGAPSSVYLESQAVVCGGLVFAPVVLAVIDIDVVQFEEAHQGP